MLIYHQRQLVEFIHVQMQAHYWEKATGYDVIAGKGFTELKHRAYTTAVADPIHDVRQTVQDRSRIAQIYKDPGGPGVGIIQWCSCNPSFRERILGGSRMSSMHVIHSDPDILGGTPVFIGTRVPVKTLLDYLEAGEPLDVFLDHFPSVSRSQAIAALELAKEMLISHAHSS